MTRIELGATVTVTDDRALFQQYHKHFPNSSARSLVEMLIDLADLALSQLPGVEVEGADAARPVYEEVSR